MITRADLCNLLTLARNIVEQEGPRTLAVPGVQRGNWGELGPLLQGLLLAVRECGKLRASARQRLAAAAAASLDDLKKVVANEPWCASASPAEIRSAAAAVLRARVAESERDSARSRLALHAALYVARARLRRAAPGVCTELACYVAESERDSARSRLALHAALYVARARLRRAAPGVCTELACYVAESERDSARSRLALHAALYVARAAPLQPSRSARRSVRGARPARRAAPGVCTELACYVAESERDSARSRLALHAALYVARAAPLQVCALN
ncbi:hypothetical protein ACJJTC_009834 [Scirpophaga incertulas]